MRIRKGIIGQHNKSLKPTATRVTPFADMAIIAPRCGGLVPPLGGYDLRFENTNITTVERQQH